MLALTGMSRRSGFTLIEIMIAVVIIGVLLSVAVPCITRARDGSRLKSCVKNMTIIESAKEQYAIDARMNEGDGVFLDDLVPAYIRNQPECPAGGEYDPKTIGTLVDCDYNGHDLDE